MKKIDYTKPVQVQHNPDREVIVENILSDGSAVVNVGPSHHLGWVLFGPYGDWRAAQEGDSGGSSLKLEQAPTRKTIYLRLSSFVGQDQTSIHEEAPGGSGVASIAVTIDNGIVVDVNLDRTNENQINAIYVGPHGDGKVVNL